MSCSRRRLLQNRPLFFFCVSFHDRRCQLLPSYLYVFIHGLQNTSPASHQELFFTHATDVRSRYSLIKWVKMSWIVEIVQYFSGGKLHMHGFVLTNQVKWWDWNSLPCSMSLKICHWFQASGANQHLHVFQLWSPPPLNTVEIIVGTPSIRAAYDGLHLWCLNKYTEELASTEDTNCSCYRFFNIREIVLLLNHPKVLVTPTENKRQCSSGPRFPRIIFSFHVSALTSWPKHNSRVFVFFFGSIN